MHRLLVETSVLSQENPSLPSDALKHLKVLRPKGGEEIELFDGCGAWRVYAFRGSTGSPLSAASEIFSVPPRAHALTLFACITKGSRWDWTIEKATELGVTRIVPVISDRTIVRIPSGERAAKRARWQRIAEDAARQSDAKWLPEICAAVDFKDSLALVQETTCFIGALTTPPSPPLAQAIRATQHPTPSTQHTSSLIPHPSSLSVFIGPEGDLTPDELASLMKIAIPTSFGPTILRAETAALFALSVLSAHLTGELK